MYLEALTMFRRFCVVLCGFLVVFVLMGCCCFWEKPEYRNLDNYQFPIDDKHQVFISGW